MNCRLKQDTPGPPRFTCHKRRSCQGRFKLIAAAAAAAAAAVLHELYSVVVFVVHVCVVPHIARAGSQASVELLCILLVCEDRSSGCMLIKESS